MSRELELEAVQELQQSSVPIVAPENEDEAERLFQQALKHAPVGHPLHHVFEQAFVVTQQTVTQVNAHVRACGWV